MIKKSTAQKLEDKIKMYLSGTGLTEVIGYSFISPKDNEHLNLPEEHSWRRMVRVANPLSEEQSVMRTALLPNLLQTASKNFSRSINELAIFELGRVFHPREGEKLPGESKLLGLLISGRQRPGWQWQEEEFDFYYLKGVIEGLTANLGFGIKLKPISQVSYLHPGRGAAIFSGDIELGFVGEVHPEVNRNYDIDQKVYVAQLDMEKFLPLWDNIPQHKPIGKYPAVQRDMAVVLPENVSAAEVKEVVSLVGGKLLREISLFDVYRGRQIPEGHKSMAYALTYQSEERTLKDEEVQKLHEEIQKNLQQKFGAQLR